MKNNVILYDNYGSVIANGVNYEWRGDFLGFTIGNTHSSELGIVRVSDGSRYKEDYIPNFNDVTATVPGKDGAYYFGSNYTQRTFTIKFAFDNLTDSQLRKLRQVLGKKEPQDLIFDETPYKVYTVKANGQPNLSYVGFDDEESRVYKGEGEISFIAYYPFARSRYKYLEDYNNVNIPEWRGVESNLNEWKNSSGIVSKNSTVALGYGGGQSVKFWDGIIDTPDDKVSNCFFTPLHNPGDLITYPKIALQFNKKEIEDAQEEIIDGDIGVSIGVGTSPSADNKISFDTKSLVSFLNANPSYIGVVLDCEKKLIFPLLSLNGTTWNYDKTKVYNNLIYEGDFLSIPICNIKDSIVLQTLFNDSYFTKVWIDYQYLYY